MQRILCGSLALCLVLAGVDPVRADDQAEARALIDRAIKAAGGEANLAKLKAFTCKGKGKATADNQEVSISCEATMLDLDKSRLDMDAEVNAMKMMVSIVVNGDQAWAKANERISDAPEEVRAVLKADLHALRIAQMLVPLTDKAYQLSPLGELKVGDRPALGLRVTHKDHREVSLFFDKETGLPVKCELSVIDMKDGQEVPHEFLLSDPKETDGIQHFTRITFKRDGKQFLEMELSDIKPQDKLDDSAFAKQ
jgi:hypothetical protein